MAYLDLAFDLPRSAIAPANTAPRHDAVALVTPLERQVVQLARHDSRATLRAPGKIGAALLWLFGHRRANTLADPRLEALRRYAVMFRLKGETLPQVEIDRLLAAGFRHAAIDEIRRLVRDIEHAA